MMTADNPYVKDANETFHTSIHTRQLSAVATSKGGADLTIDFDKMQTRLVIEGLVTQVILPLDPLVNIKKGDVVGITFGGVPFEDFKVEVVDVTHTTVERVGYIDAFKCGFAYRPFLYEYLERKGLTQSDKILKVDFRLIE